MQPKTQGNDYFASSKFVANIGDSSDGKLQVFLRFYDP